MSNSVSKISKISFVSNLQNSIKQRFVKDFSLPITIFNNDLFYYYCITLNDFLDIENKAKLLYNFIKNNEDVLENKEKFFEISSKFNTDVIEYIKGKESFNKFLQFDMNKFKVHNYKNSNIYHSDNDSKYYFTVDLIKGNFQAFKYFDPNIVDNMNDYENFIKQFTKYDYFVQSKYIRQVIFGHLNTKRQQTIMKYIMMEIYKKIEKYLDNIFELECLNNDELIFNIKVPVFNNKYKKKIIFLLKELKKLPFNLKVNIFKLKHLKPENMYVKEYINRFLLYTWKDDIIEEYLDNYKKIEFKCVPNNVFMQVFKYYFNMELDDRDLYFYYDKRLAKWLKPLFE
ncbi:conserved hypothetical protein (plasmid) [Deferribacter desulfuricans SSM1]|uniref:Uncharacterized protein n=1 Tax=Deferribacter desulfuricans (strain DSM 14783 / JCM 11476 / NBRC 101012 / SSM1) TaxID=639282 RepID=D3PEW1_DEFDS|nr:hypothetical protein [Deferribacter desulfuricans]BAI81753.1 conserved hypothetical protein [Deferribacter desulfuricans SSM1]